MVGCVSSGKRIVARPSRRMAFESGLGAETRHPSVQPSSGVIMYDFKSALRRSDATSLNDAVSRCGWQLSAVQGPQVSSQFPNLWVAQFLPERWHLAFDSRRNHVVNPGVASVQIM